MLFRSDCRHFFCLAFSRISAVQLSNTEEVGYTSTVKSAFETMKEGDYAGISSYIPDTTNPNNEIFAYQQPKIKQKFAELWTKVKAK